MKRVIGGKIFYIFILFLIFNFDNFVYANTEETVPTKCIFSEEYLEWDKLSDEEKERIPIPSICDSKKNQSITSSIDKGVKFLLKQSNNALPTYFNLRQQSYNVPIKNQRQTNGCWAFATTSNLEILMKKNYFKDYTFSTRHIEYANTRSFLNNQINDWGYNRNLGDGGNYYMSSNYLINGIGPISEEEMPFENNENPISISEIQNKNVLLDVNDILLEYNSDESCSRITISNMKKYIYEYGSIASTIYMTNDSRYYNSKTYSLNYNGGSSNNHAVTIVGWDDNYSKDNFSVSNKPENDGAWIVQNSYGSSWGDSGYFYISYEDINICNLYMTVTNVDQEKEDNSYIYDKLGHMVYFGFKDTTTGLQYTTAYTMNVFTKQKNIPEVLKEVTFGSNGTGTYKIYYQEGNGTTSSSERILIGTGRMDYAGYITHKLEKDIIIDNNVSSFSILVYYSMDTSTSPIPVSYSGITKYENITLEEGLSYISYNGKTWTDLTKMEKDTVIIASIKAFTNDVLIPSINIENVETTTLKNNIYKVNVNVTYSNVDINNLTLKVFNTENNEIEVSTTTFSSNKIEVTFNKKIIYDTYKAHIYYNDIELGTFEFVLGDKLISNTYLIDQEQLLIYVQPSTNMNNFRLNVDGLSDAVINENSNKNILGTGMQINGYTIISVGDVTGDGHVKINDVMKISNYIIEGNGLDNTYYQIAADVTKDSNIKINDVMKISNYIIEGGNL